jgi:hypothetical protein
MVCVAFVSLLFAGPIGAATRITGRVVVGQFVVEPATLHSIGFEWYLSGDDNHNAAVAVSYRKRGQSDWKPAQSLIHLDHEFNNISVGAGSDGHLIHEGPGVFIAPNVFVGSIFNLEPGTEYECRFVLSDPDGVSGTRQKIVTVRTRAVPMPAAGGHVYNVYPYTDRGPFKQPAFYGLYAAFYDSNGVGADHFNAYPPRVQPGDTILVHAGVYREERFYYGSGSRKISSGRVGGSCCGTNWDGTYYLTASGTADKPIVIKAAGDGEVIFDGAGNHTLFNVEGGNYIYFEGITFRNTDVAIQAGQKGIAGSFGLTVKYCKFDHVGEGVHTDWSGSGDYYIADNDFIGKADPDTLVGFAIRPPFDKVPGLRKELTQDLSQYAVKLYGSGNVVAYNRVRYFHDGIDFATYGLPDGYPNMIRARMPVSNDFNNNDISMVHDDCIESDGSLYNMRVYRNLCANAAGSGISTQPVWGLVYIIRNIVYHDPSPFAALKLATPTAAVIYQNTFLAPVYGGRMPEKSSLLVGGPILLFRNNLILAEDPEDAAFVVGAFTNLSSSDYNGFMAGAQSQYRYSWVSPPFSDHTTDYSELLVKRTYATLKEYAQATGQDTHSIEVGYDVFANLSAANYYDPTRVYDVDKLDFRLKVGGAAVDKGAILPNINDGYVGSAPDLGALELGAPGPHYGPRCSSGYADRSDMAACT